MEENPKARITSQSGSDRISVELSSRRTGMSFQRTRMSADRTLMSVIRTSLSLIGFGFTIFQGFQKLQETQVLKSSAAPRHFGIALVLLGIGMLGQAGRWQSPYHDTMIDHDKNVGQMLDLLDELGIAENTFVMYSTDNGPHRNSWPDGAMTPFRSEKNTNWEGAFRVPMVVRWPGKIKAGSVSNEIVQHHDWFPTFLAMAGEPDILEKVKKGYQAIGRTYKNHIDGFNLVPYLTGEQKESPRKLFMYISDDGDVLALRYDNWKVVFTEQRCHGTLQVWAEPFTRLRLPKIYNLRTDPYEFADITSNSYYEWYLYHVYILYGAYAIADKFAATFKDFPPIQKPNTFTIDDALKMMQSASTSS